MPIMINRRDIAAHISDCGKCQEFLDPKVIASAIQNAIPIPGEIPNADNVQATIKMIMAAHRIKN